MAATGMNKNQHIEASAAAVINVPDCTIFIRIDDDDTSIYKSSYVCYYKCDHICYIQLNKTCLII